ncbi:MAG: glutamine-hydrolyzing carbamoyl-phosphate synthase small subunit [Bdellovibrio sp.]|nr:glutamine-hydrolyzing carbamoyl-phosphate synthase small subunit [Bdellovibrio sp.]
MSEKGILFLEDGTVFEGTLFGAPTSAAEIHRWKEKRDYGYGEVVFNTSLTGYQEILTDPSYYGQIICMTAAHIGNTGTNSEDLESARPWCGGFVIRENSETTSNWRSEQNLQDYLFKMNVPAICNVDTRALTRHLRSKGVLRGILLPAKEKEIAAELLRSLPRFEGRDLIGEVTTREPYLWRSSQYGKAGATAFTSNRKTPTRKFKVVALDFGIKWNLLRALEERGCEIEVVPAKTNAKEILARKPHGVFLSNGPGDPTGAPYAIDAVQQLVGKVPLFGVCMGQQILALALGGKTFKLRFGHRGGNQPVLDHASGCVEISSHNHGYAVDSGSLPKRVEVTHINLNDKTVEGIRVRDADAFAVQYHPESCPGPHDSLIHFDRFIDMMNRNVSKVS